MALRQQLKLSLKLLFLLHRLQFGLAELQLIAWLRALGADIFLDTTSLAHNVVGMQNLLVKTLDAFLWSGQHLVLFVFDLPVDDVLAPVANAVVLYFVDGLAATARVVQVVFEGRFVLVLGRFQFGYISSLGGHAVRSVQSDFVVNFVVDFKLFFMNK